MNNDSIRFLVVYISDYKIRRRSQSVICPYLLRGYDAIQFLKLHRGTQLFFILLYTEHAVMSFPCNKHERLVILQVLISRLQ